MSSIFDCLNAMKPSKPRLPSRSFLERDYGSPKAPPALARGSVAKARRGQLPPLSGGERRRLLRRHSAALLLLRQGAMDGDLLLSYVIWPTPAIERALDSVLHEVAVERVQERGPELLHGDVLEAAFDV